MAPSFKWFPQLTVLHLSWRLLVVLQQSRFKNQDQHYINTLKRANQYTARSKQESTAYETAGKNISRQEKMAEEFINKEDNVNRIYLIITSNY